MGGMKSSPPAPKPKPAAPPPRATLTAVEMGARQREISISEFFTKNRHLLGFDNPRKALLTCVKEAVDNALDACEEAGILPDVAAWNAGRHGDRGPVSEGPRLRRRVSRTDDHRESARQADVRDPGRRDEGVSTHLRAAPAVAARDQAASLWHRARNAAQDAAGHEQPFAVGLSLGRFQSGLARRRRGDMQDGGALAQRAASRRPRPGR